jgi:predicted RND superfamily exporter protein
VTAATRATQRFVAWTLRRGLLLWMIGLVLAVPALVRTVHLYAHLRSELEELLPKDAPSVKAIGQLRLRMAGLQHLGVLVDVGEARNLSAGERFLDDLAGRVRSYPPDLVRGVRTGIEEERAFLEKHAALYLDLEDLVTIKQRVEDRRDFEVSHATGLALDEDEKAPPLDFDDILNKYKTRNMKGSLVGDRFSSEKQHATLLLIEVGGFDTGVDQGKRLLERVRADIADLGGPGNYAPGMRHGFTGDVAINVEEMSALVTDLALSTSLVIAAVTAVIAFYYRWWRSVPILLAPLILSTLYTFALVTLPPFSIHELNSNTAFLGSIIVGNGINFGIILLARYVEARREGRDVEESLVLGVDGARVGTLSAALAAGAAYGSLIITDFRGFRQFGVIGGIGMVLCWLVAFVLMPSLIRFLDRGSSARAATRSAPLMSFVARTVVRAPKPIVAGALVLTLFAALTARRLDRNRLEFDFSKLRRADTFVNGEGYWGRRMDELLGRYLTPTVVLTDSHEHAEHAGKKLRSALSSPPLDAILASVLTVDDVLPKDQAAKLAEADAIRKMLTPRIREAIPAEHKITVQRLIDEGSRTPITVADLPHSFVAGLRERDGTIGKAVLVYPKPNDAMWNGDALVAYGHALRQAAIVPGDPAPQVAGSLVLSADIIEAIRRDGLLATGCAFALVVFVVALIFRRGRATVYVVGSLCLGVLWLVALTIVTDVKLNFANFIAFPITFGIGVDYAVNIVSRYLQDEGDVTHAIRSTGGAVGLCSLTTIIGYSSLLLAENRALFSFGLIAVLGEIACLVTAVLVLPAFLVLFDRNFRASRRVG